MQITSKEQLIKALDISNLPIEQQEELLLDLNSLVFESTLLRLIESMNESTKEAFNTLLDTNPSEDQLELFLFEHVPDADRAVQETLDELTNDILAVTGPVTS